MDSILMGWYQVIADQADHCRAWLLKLTLAWPALRLVFRHRAMRLAALFLLSCALTLTVSIYLPLWVLAIGPAVYGVPHLFASLRYFHYAAGDGHGLMSRRLNIWRWVGGIMMGVAFYRFAISLNFLHLPVTQLSEWRGSTYLELAAMLLLFAVGQWIYRRSWKQGVGGALLLAPLVGCFVYNPFATIGFLVLAHNFVAFIYWWLAAQTRQEKGVAAAAGTIVLAVTVMIFAGGFDGLYRAHPPADSLAFAHLSFTDIGQMITPWSETPALWLHAAVAYAFGQAMHYFVWLKAIPDQYHRSEIPTSFKQSLRLLEEDFGRAWAGRIISLSLLSLTIWFGLQFPQARAIYFCLAGFHGYLEIAGLALVLSG